MTAWASWHEAVNFIYFLFLESSLFSLACVANAEPGATHLPDGAVGLPELRPNRSRFGATSCTGCYLLLEMQFPGVQILSSVELVPAWFTASPMVWLDRVRLAGSPARRIK